MKNHKAVYWPFGATLMLLIVSLGKVTMYISLTNRYHDQGLAVFQTSFLVETISFFVLISAEVILYYILRSRLYTMRWVWAHVSLLYFSLLILPILQFLVFFFAGNMLNEIARFQQFTFLRVIVFWAAICFAHVFFVLTIVHGFKKQKREEAPAHESTNILDEFNK